MKRPWQVLNSMQIGSEEIVATATINDESSLQLAGPGEQLRLARIAKQFTVDDIAMQLRLTKRCVNDIEHDDYSQGIPFIFIRGYLRAYARLVAIDAEEIMDAFDSLGLTDDRALPDSTKVVTKSVINVNVLRWLSYAAIVIILITSLAWWRTRVSDKAEMFSLLSTVDNEDTHYEISANEKLLLAVDK